MNYFENYEDWSKLIEYTFVKTGFDKTYIERDLLQSMFLYELSILDLPYVFKGGTCLSKAFHVINRYSEDIDVGFTKRPTIGERKKTKRNILNLGEKLGLTIVNFDNLRSRRDFNRYHFTYNSPIDNEEHDLFLEMSFIQETEPSLKKNISSFIGEQVSDNKELINKFPYLNFEMLCQTLERTFLDKLFAISDCLLKNKTERNSRHIYDIAKLFPLMDFSEEGMKELKILRDRVRESRKEANNQYSCQDQYDINELLNSIIKTRFFENDYLNHSNKLLLEDMTYDEAIEKGIKKVIEIGLFN